MKRAGMETLTRGSPQHEAITMLAKKFNTLVLAINFRNLIYCNRDLKCKKMHRPSMTC